MSTMTPKRRPHPCESCRGRHLKCDGDGSDPCSNCKRSDLECIVTSKTLRFKNTTRPKRTLGFSKYQPWVDTERKEIAFVDEASGFGPVRDPNSEGDSSPTFTEHVEHQNFSRERTYPEEVQSPSQHANDSLLFSPKLPKPVISEQVQRESPPLGDRHNFVSLPVEQVFPTTEGHAQLMSVDTCPISPSANTTAFAVGVNDAPALLSIGPQEACLIRHYVENLAHAFDTTDRDSHFTISVPHRARHSAVLLYAICTTAARHLTSLWSRQNPNTTIYLNGISLPDLNAESAIHYHNICLSLLMDFTNIPASEANAEERADALAATTILRFYEQLDTSLTGLDAEAYQSVVHTVMCTHHTESLFSLENIEKFHRDTDGRLLLADGLRSSACLIALRQEIWSVLLYRRPFRLPLSPNLDYSKLGPTDDYTWTNRMILWCADVLRYCFGPDTATILAHRSSNLAFARWDAMKAFEEWWTSSPPPCFKPLFYAPPDPARGSHFPVIWHVNNCQVQCMQHLELGRMLLAVYNPRRQRVGIGSSAMNKATEAQLCQSILRLCGLALADKRMQSGMTTAAIGISIGGEYFQKTEEQDAIISFLKILDEEHAWPTKTVVMALRDAWRTQDKEVASRPSGPASV